jgi:imidazolonepropionase-like amidohydrolase
MPRNLRALGTVAIAIMSFGGVAPATAEVTVIRSARILDVVVGRILEPGLVVVDGDRIVGTDLSAVPAGARTIDLGDATLLPGLIDSHIHLQDEPGSSWVTQRAYETTALMTLRAARNARRSLLHGFTTVRDMGSTGFVDIAVSKGVERGWIEGPTVIPVGHYITITGGHCDLTGFAPGVLERGTEGGVADGPDEVIKAIRYQIKHGAKWIKVCATAGVFSFEGPVGAQQLSESELRAAVEEAARHGVRVAAHAHGREGILASIRAGVSSIEHGSELTAEIIALMKERGIWLVPQAYLWDAIDRSTLTEIVRRKAELIAPVARRSLEQAIKAGLKIAFSTDGPLPKDDPWREFVALVDRGMTPTEAIQSATVRAAEMLNLDDRGRIATGLRADLVAVSGDPSRSADAMQNVIFVMQAGVVRKR